MHHASLESLSDDDLHAAVRRLTARSNVTFADLLAHLGEVETRGIHRSRACATLYTYGLYELRLSEDAAYRRAKAARLVHQHPDLRGILARGELHLTGLLMIGPYLGGERHAEVLERARFRSKREIARLIAEIDPKPEVPPRIEPIAAVRRPATMRAMAEAFAGPVRSLPVGDRPEDWVDRDEPGAATDPAQDTAACGTEGDASRESSEEDLAEAESALEGAWQARRAAPMERPLRYGVQFTASQEYVDLLDEALDLLGYGKKAANLPEVQLRALREFVARLRKRRTGARGDTSDAPAREPETTLGDAPARVGETTERDAPRSDAPARVGETTEREAARSDAPAREPKTTLSDATLRGSEGSQPRHDRYVPVTVRRAVWARDASRCAYVDERGRRCSEKRGLHVHHREAHARGGPATVDNLELRCPAHNTLAAEQDFGRGYMDWVRGRGPADRHAD